MSRHASEVAVEAVDMHGSAVEIRVRHASWEPAESVDMCVDMRVDMCVRMRVDVCADMCPRCMLSVSTCVWTYV